MAFGVFHLQPLGADSSQAEKSSPPPGQQINLRREVAHQGRLKKMHSALKPREPTRSRSLAEKLREELKNSITLSAERKSCSPAFLFIFFPSLLKKCLIFTSVKLERQEVIQRLFTKPGFFLLGHLC